MKRYISTSIVFCLFFLTVGTPFANAQSRYFSGRTPFSWGSSWYHSATVGESHARGLGALNRDIGEANLLNSMAAGEYEKARSIYIRNTLDATQAYYDRKRIREAYYAKKKIEKRQALNRFFARRGSIPVFTQDNVDPSTGKIVWPQLLRSEAYDEYRIRYEFLASQYFLEGELSPAEFKETQKISREWRKQLGEDRHDFIVEHVRKAIRFVLAIDNEFKRS